MLSHDIGRIMRNSATEIYHISHGGHTSIRDMARGGRLTYMTPVEYLCALEKPD